jgi:glycosyltransferase involved in cell wall biosynthesis
VIGCRGEAGPEEIAAAGGGIRLVPPGDPEALAAELRLILDEPAWRRELGDAARATVEAEFTWERCGRATVAAYEEAMRAGGAGEPTRPVTAPDLQETRR